jgi:hypothetical protein
VRACCADRGQHEDRTASGHPGAADHRHEHSKPDADVQVYVDGHVDSAAHGLSYAVSQSYSSHHSDYARDRLADQHAHPDPHQ